MKQTCILCERSTPDNNLYCQEVYCPAEMSPTILEYGEWLGDIEIVKPVSVLRSAVLYEAVHQKQKVYLKVAHPGEENKERLKREAVFLQRLRGNPLSSNEYLPDLLPPYAGTSANVDPYGKTMLRNHLLYFYMFKHVEAQPLRDVLMENPQLWVNHVGWITISLCSAIAYLHSYKLFHAGLQPEGILVRFDEKINVPRVLLVDFGLASDAKSFNAHWRAYTEPSAPTMFVSPAYTAPELATNGPTRPAYTMDVYGLGLVLYELLVGEPAYSYKLKSDDDVHKAIRRNQRVRMSRKEDAKEVANIALKATNPQPEQRPKDATALAKELIQVFGKVPPEPKSRFPQMKNLMVIGSAMLAVAVVITLAVFLIP